MGMTEEYWKKHEMSLEQLSELKLGEEQRLIVSGTRFEKGKLGGRTRKVKYRAKGGTKCSQYLINKTARNRAKNKAARKARRKNRK